MDLNLRGAKVLVTAASQGLGRATARQFSLEGAQVVISSRSLDKLQTAASEINSESGNPVFTIAADVSDANAATKLVNNAAEMLGGLDILITNAGGPPGGRFVDFELDAWRSAIDLILLSAVNLIKAALPHLRQSSRAAVLAVVSIAGKEPQDNLTLSNVIRPAVIGLTKTLSFELGKEGIRFNSLLPGITETDRVTHLAQLRAEQNNITPEEAKNRMSASIPIGRIGKPEEFGNAAVFLCSPAAGFINGVALLVDGGASHSIL